MYHTHYPSNGEILSTINERSYFILRGFYDQQFCQTVVEQINDGARHFREGDGKDLRCWNFEKHSSCASTFLNSNFLNNLCAEFVGCPIIKTRCQAGVIKREWGPVNSGGGWHVDNHEKQFKALLYLTDVTEQNGPFCLLTSSSGVHRTIRTYPKISGDTSETRYYESELRKNIIWENKKIITGNTGDVILVDTSNIHCGMDIQNGERYTLTNYYYT